MKLFQLPLNTGKYLPAVLASGWTTTGLECGRLIDALSVYLNIARDKICLASSATAGWQAILDWAPLKCVQITKATWPGMHQVIEHNGNPLVDRLAHIQVRTDIGGARCDDLPWESQVRVRDAAHSWLVDKTADFTLLSFYPTKLIPSGSEGGVVVCRRARDAEQLRLHLYCGMIPGSAGSGRPPVLCGRKSNMTDTAAALNREALELAPAYIAAIGDAWAQLADCAYARDVPFRAQPVRPYLAQVEMPADRIPDTMSALKARGIPSAWNFNPAGLLTLPCYPGMTLTDADRVIDAVSKEVPSR